MFTANKNSKLERRSRQIKYISQCTTDIRHISGSSNVVADALSRLDVEAIEATVTPQIIADEQIQDVETQQLREKKDGKYEIRDVSYDPSNLNSILICVVHNGLLKPIVPKNLQKRVFQQTHGLSHPGVKATLRLLRAKYFWTNMVSDIRKWTKSCLQCQLNKVTRHTKSPLGTFPPCQKFEHVHVDLVQLTQQEDGSKYVFTMIDRMSRWIEAVPLTNITAETIAKNFYQHWIARYGVPLKLTSDRGGQFIYDLLQQLGKLLGAEHIKTTSYHPQSNGKVERLHKQLKAALKCHGRDWLVHLPTVLLGIRAAPSDETGVSRAEVTFGKTLRLPGEFFNSPTDLLNGKHDSYVSKLRQSLRHFRPMHRDRNQKGKIFIHKDLENVSHVFVRVDKVKDPLESPYEGPFRVLKRTPKWYLLQIDDEKKSISIDRLKPGYVLEDDIEKIEQAMIGKKSCLRNEPRKTVSGKKVTFVNSPVLCTYTHTSTPGPSNQNVSVSQPLEIFNISPEISSPVSGVPQNPLQIEHKTIPTRIITRSGRCVRPNKEYS